MGKKFELLDKISASEIDKKVEIPETLPVIATRTNMIVFPSSVLPLYIGREKSLSALEESINKYNQLLLFVSQKDFAKDNVDKNDLFTYGTVGKIIQLVKMPDGNYKVLVEGLERAEITDFLETEDLFLVKTKVNKSKYKRTKILEALIRKVKKLSLNYVGKSKKYPDEIMIPLDETSSPDKFSDFVSSMFPFKFEDKQYLLEELLVKKRLEKLLDLLTNEVELLDLEEKIDERVKSRIEENQREYYLREKMKAIQDELEDDDEDILNFKKIIDEKDLPEEVKDKAEKEIARLEKTSSFSPEAAVIRNYVDWLLGLPWNEYTKDEKSLKKVRKVLNDNHYGLEDVKDRIIEFLAARNFSKNLRAPILCLVGPPGVGKTSLGKSISEAMNRNFGRVSLGGMRDEAEIRGHRRTYVGALPGRIIQTLKKMESRNPVIVLDEVDKMGVSFQGDPAAALLEVLDPEQNKDFTDNFLEIPFDLSDILFVTTANVLNTIHPALRDRMEIIEISGYTGIEKLHIAKEHIIPKTYVEYSVNKSQLKITDAALRKLIREYTRESGVRNLDRMINKAFRGAIAKIAEGEAESIKIGVKELKEFLGSPRYKEDDYKRKEEVGMANGLAWTSVGGELMYIEVLPIPGKGKTIFTGQLGEVMKESAQIAMSLSRSICSGVIDTETFEKSDFHIHAPEGAVPKDGPSAGVTLTTAIISSVLKVPVRPDIAMTGEITLTGRVLPIGGLKEKLMAAFRLKMKEVIIPAQNKADLEKVPDEIKNNLKINFAEKIDDVLKIALVKNDKLG
jgi:ATP-dependent Lon protease